MKEKEERKGRKGREEGMGERERRKGRKGGKESKKEEMKERNVNTSSWFKTFTATHCSQIKVQIASQA
jgi:hypothetical protein